MVFDQQFLPRDYLVISGHYGVKKYCYRSYISPLSCCLKIKSLDSIFHTLRHVKLAISFFSDTLFIAIMHHYCFSKSQLVRKIFNRNTLKLSYSCMPNIRNVISGHNKSVVRKFTSTDDPSTKPRPFKLHRNKSSHPFHGKCLTSNEVHHAIVVRNDTNHESYVGHIEEEFKKRYNCQTRSFRLSKYRNATELNNEKSHCTDNTVVLIRLNNLVLLSMQKQL